MRSRFSASLLGALAVGLGTASPAQGFLHHVVATQLDSPIAIAVAPDGRVFVTLQGGAVRVIKDDLLLQQPFVVVPTIADDEEGLTGITFDPAFATNGFVYLRYTVQQPTRHNRVVRWTAQGDVAVPGSEVTLFDLDTNQAHFHLGCALQFGADGKLYFATGDNDTGFFAGSLGSLHGKLLRINADGTIPTDNPFYGQLTGPNRAIHALGFRNAFELAVHPTTGMLVVNDIGAAGWEEVDVVVPGGDYGWPAVEGPGNTPPAIDPLYAYPHTATAQGGCAITGGAFYVTATPQLPGQFVGRYLFTDYCRNEIRALDPANPTSATVLAPTPERGPTDLAVAPDGALYYLTRGNSFSSGGTGMPYGSLVKITAPGFEVPTFTTYGTGCRGALGVPYITANSPPRLGNLGCRLVLGALPTNTLVAVVVGFSEQTSRYGPLPFDLGTAGMAGCSLLVSDDAAGFAVATGNTASLGVPIPNAANLLGVTVRTQGFVADPGINAAGVTATMGGRLRVGN